MNDRPDQKRFREGFVDDQKPERSSPAPIIEPSPIEMEATDASLPTETWPIIVKLLHKSVRNNKGETLRELAFREPRGGDINRYGNPVRVNQDGDVVIDERKMHFIMAALADILPPFLDQMDPRDWNSCAYRLRSFFLPHPEAW
jgi:hypothetical protein